MTGRVLVAGVGNVFLGDDGFGVEVARRLAGEALPEGVTAADYGIRGIHLAYELLDGYDTLILVDALSRGEPPGTIFLVRPDVDGLPATQADPHGMDPGAVFGYLQALGGRLPRTLIVGCEPQRTDEEMGLSEPVARAVNDAVMLIYRLLADEMEEKQQNGKAPIDRSPAEVVTQG